MKSDKRKRKKENIIKQNDGHRHSALRQKQIIEVSRSIHINNLTIIAK